MGYEGSITLQDRCSRKHWKPTICVLQCIKMKCPIETVHERLRWVCPRQSADDEVDHSLKRSRDISELEGLSERDCFGMEYLGYPHGCVNMVRAN